MNLAFEWDALWEAIVFWSSATFPHLSIHTIKAFYSNASFLLLESASKVLPLFARKMSTLQDLFLFVVCYYFCRTCVIFFLIKFIKKLCRLCCPFGFELAAIPFATISPETFKKYFRNDKDRHQVEEHCWCARRLRLQKTPLKLCKQIKNAAQMPQRFEHRRTFLS